MKSNTALSCVTLACCAALGATNCALAQDAFGYGGLSLGQARAHLDEARIAQEQITPGLTITGITRDTSSDAYKVFGGYQFNRYFAMEAGFFDLGHFSMAADTLPAGSFQGKFAVQGANLDLISIMPLGNSWAATARLGANFARTRAEFAGTGAVSVLDPNPSFRATRPKIGLGLQVEVSPHVILRTDLERLRINDAVGHNVNVNMWTLGLVVPFGRTGPARPAMAQAPAYVAPMPMPAAEPVAVVPVAVAPPVKPAPAPLPAKHRVVLSAESLFGFDQSVMREEGKVALDNFAKSLVGTEYQQIQVEGHADRLGGTGYNQTLSVERAEAVKNYLVTVAGLDAAKVNAVGVGETQPHTVVADCQQNLGRTALVACLQPDRRVEIEVTGMR